MRTRVSLTVALAAVLTIGTLAGCGGDDESDDRADTVRTTTTASDETTTTKPERQIEPNAALLGLEDMPTGYSPQPNSDDKSDAKRCPQLDALDEANGDPLDKAEVTFAAGQTGPFVNHQVSVLEKGIAERQFDELRSALDEPACQTFTDTTEDGKTATFTVSALSAPRLGDDTLALRLSGDEAALSVMLDVVFERLGDAVSFLGITSVPVLGGPAPPLEPLARRADEKLSAA